MDKLEKLDKDIPDKNCSNESSQKKQMLEFINIIRYNKRSAKENIKSTFEEVKNKFNLIKFEKSKSEMINKILMKAYGPESQFIVENSSECSEILASMIPTKKINQSVEADTHDNTYKIRKINSSFSDSENTIKNKDKNESGNKENSEQNTAILKLSENEGVLLKQKDKISNDRKTVKESASLEFLVIENKTKKEYQQSDLEGENLTVELSKVEADKLLPYR